MNTSALTEEFYADRPYLEHKYHAADKPFNSFARLEHHGWDGDPSTGWEDAELKEHIRDYVASLPDTDHAVIKAKAYAYVLDHMRINVCEHDYFVLFWNWNRPINFATIFKWQREIKTSEETQRFISGRHAAGDVNIWMDYEHSVPDWTALYTLGFSGIRRRAQEYRKAFEAEHGTLTAEQAGYYDAIDIEYAAIERLIVRMRDLARTKPFPKAKAIADCLDTLSKGAPVTLYERLMLMYFYWMLSESVDSYQVRSLGNGFDRDTEEPFRADLEAGRYTEEELNSFLAYFLMQFSAIGNYWGQPLYLGGSNLDGSTRVTEQTMRVLDIYDTIGIFNPKLHVKYSPSSPDAYLSKLCDMIRRGHSSMVFVCDDNVRRMMTEIRGIPEERAFDYDVKGCYEYAVRAGEISTAPFYTNLLGPLTKALDKCGDGDSYETLEARYFEEVAAIYEGGIRACNELETHLREVSPAPMLSATLEHSLRLAKDGYSEGSEYNTSAIITGALASAVDALMALKQLVWVQKAVTLSEFKRILAENWSDPELHARALTLPQKFGCGEKEADACAQRICDFIAQYQGRPNVRGGVWKIDMHSARQYIDLGKLTPATPDGRFAGEETSKNASPVQGMDKKGVTALIRSAIATKPDRFTEGYGFDVMLHTSAVKGEDGLEAMKALLRAYDQGGGSSIQFNVFDAETLKDAQVHPERYQNLQIRVCGWNILFNQMAKEEQDYFIRRAEALV